MIKAFLISVAPSAVEDPSYGGTLSELAANDVSYINLILKARNAHLACEHINHPLNMNSSSQYNTFEQATLKKSYGLVFHSCSTFSPTAQFNDVVNATNGTSCFTFEGKAPDVNDWRDLDYAQFVIKGIDYKSIIIKTP